jgi:transcription antitermination factor NusG
MKYVKPLYENENGEKFSPGDLVIISSGQFKYFLGKSRERV